MENDNNAKALFDKLRTGQLSGEELDVLETWYNNWPADEPVGLTEEQLNAALARLDRANPYLLTDQKPVRLWQYVVRIAAVAIFALLCGVLYQTYIHQDKSDLANLAAAIHPGRSGATLTLSNGKQIMLDKSTPMLINGEKGITILRDSTGKIEYPASENMAENTAKNTLSTSNGQQYQLKLPDGSLVWLNATSSITYPASFKGAGERKVSLSGEAYFEVAKDKDHPFVVASTGQQVEVLGTHFNISTFPEERESQTTLAEGSVKINGQLLKPDEQAVRTGTVISIRHVDAANYTSWKDGIFVFTDERLETIMSKVSRWYNVKVVYMDGANKDYQYGGSVSRYDNVLTLLKKLEAAGDMHFKIKNKTIYISR